MRRWLVMCAWLLGANALAQDTPDANDIPDASIGTGGADRLSPESEDSTATTCLGDSDCDRGFRCDHGFCKFRRYRDATFEGCSSATGRATAAALLLVGLARAAPRVSSRRRKKKD